VGFPTRKDHRLRNIAIIVILVVTAVSGYFDLKILGIIGSPSEAGVDIYMKRREGSVPMIYCCVGRLWSTYWGGA